MSAPAHRFFTLGPGVLILLAVLACCAALLTRMLGGPRAMSTPSEPERHAAIDLVARDTEALRCPFCHDDLVPEMNCAGCGAGYHTECYFTYGDCAVLGCGSPPARRAT